MNTYACGSLEGITTRFSRGIPLANGTGTMHGALPCVDVPHADVTGPFGPTIASLRFWFALMGIVVIPPGDWAGLEDR